MADCRASVRAANIKYGEVNQNAQENEYCCDSLSQLPVDIK